MADIQNSGKAIIEDGSIVIRVALSALPMVLEGSWVANNLPTHYKIVNVDKFADDLLSELNAESEDGTTRIHKMFDGAIEEAINQGAFGIEEHEDQQR